MSLAAGAAQVAAASAAVQGMAWCMPRQGILAEKTCTRECTFSGSWRVPTWLTGPCGGMYADHATTTPAKQSTPGCDRKREKRDARKLCISESVCARESEQWFSYLATQQIIWGRTAATCSLPRLLLPHCWPATLSCLSRSTRHCGSIRVNSGKGRPMRDCTQSNCVIS